MSESATGGRPGTAEVRPVLLTVDDDPEVLRAIGRDLRRHYGGAYRVLRVDSGEKALDVLGKLKERNAPLALLLSDQRMPGMTGVELLERAQQLFPEVRRALLTAYADTDAAIRAINQSKIHYYLLKPWDPPEECLFPVLDDLLEDWKATYKPPFAGIRVVGDRWSPRSHEVRDFLARNLVPYRFADVEADQEARTLAGHGEALPLLVFPNGERLADPSNLQIADRIGLTTQAERTFYDLVIVGGGPAGLAAAVYGASEGLQTLLIEREAPGGQAGTSSRIENYLGFPSGLSGADLTRRAVTQAKKFGAEILSPLEAEEVRLEGPYKRITLSDGNEVDTHALMITSGVSYRRLDVPGAEQLTGCGVYYGAARTEAMSCTDEDVYIVGAGNSAGQAAMHFADYARCVHMLVRRDSLGASMSQYLVERIEAADNIEVHFNTEVKEMAGDERLESLTLVDTAQDTERTVEAASLFVFIGALPRTDWIGDMVARDAHGFILTGPDLNGHTAGWPLDRQPFLLEASVPGIFAAGDVRHGSVKRVASGVGEGSMTVSFVHQYLSKL